MVNLFNGSYTQFARSILLEVGLRLWPLQLRDVSELGSGPVDDDAAELLVEVDRAVEVQVAQVEALDEAVVGPDFKDEHVITLRVFRLEHDLFGALNCTATVLGLLKTKGFFRKKSYLQIHLTIQKYPSGSVESPRHEGAKKTTHR